MDDDYTPIRVKIKLRCETCGARETIKQRYGDLSHVDVDGLLSRYDWRGRDLRGAACVICHNCLRDQVDKRARAWADVTGSRSLNC